MRLLLLYANTWWRGFLEFKARAEVTQNIAASTSSRREGRTTGRER